MRSEQPKYEVALYARVSTKDGRQDAENQLRQLRDYCRKQGWTIVQEYIDRESGGNAKRPEFQKMFSDAQQRKFDLLLFWSLDRLSREGVRETLNHLQRLTDAGVGWKSYTEEYLDSFGPLREVVLAILAWIAKQERARISERTKAGMERAVRQGKRVGRPKAIVDVVKLQSMRRSGLSLAAIGRRVGVDAATVMRRLRSTQI